MATIQVDVRAGQNGPIYIITAPAGNTVIINDYLHPDSSVTGTGTTAPVVDAWGRRAKQQSATF